MKTDYRSSKVRRGMYEELNRLMEESEQVIFNGNGAHLYDSATHYHLMKNGWEIMFPLKKELWPDQFNEFLADGNLPWPQYATYSYIMSVLCPPFIGSYNLYFGYAVIDGKLIKTTFFAIDTIVKYQIMPQSMVIDPLCVAHGITPDYYIGCWAEKQDIDNFMVLRKNPLELFVNRKNKQEHQERLYDSYMEAYNLQMYHEPGYFPPQLIKFCEENGLYIPPQERNC
jgi:hypothetical protein